MGQYRNAPSHAYKLPLVLRSTVSHVGYTIHFTISGKQIE